MGKDIVSEKLIQIGWETKQLQPETCFLLKAIETKIKANKTPVQEGMITKLKVDND